MNNYLYDDIYIGQEEEFSIEITEEKVEAFRELTGDENPLHIDSEYAKSKGYQDRVVYGMLTASYFSTLVGMYIPGKYCLIHNVHIDFHKPVYIEENNSLKISGKVTGKQDLFKQITIKAIIENSQGDKVCKATIKVGVLDDE